MADTYARYRHICGTAAEWAVSDIVIAEGEIAVELPSAPGAKPRVKAGDGTRRFSQLPYIDGMDQAALTAILNNYLLKSDGVSTAALTTALNAETARADGAYAKLSGATMTGQLTLPGAGTGKQAATVDQITAETTRAEGAYVKLSGSTMTGQLTLLGTGTGKQAASVDQIKAAIDATGTTTGGVGKNDQLVRTDANGVIDTSLINIPGVMKIKGAQDPTAAPPTVPAPTAGDAYIASVTGVANAAFGPGVTGTVNSGDMLIYIGGAQKWDVVAANADLAAYVKKTGDTLSGNLTLNAGTANGVAYLNGTKVLTTGSALTFDGTNFATTGSVTSAGNLNFTGTGNRIIGDFDNATIASRVAFQTSTVNGNTSVAAIPNGTGTVSNLRAYNNSNIANSSFNTLSVEGTTDARFTSGIVGTGTYLPMTFYTGGSEQVRIDTAGNLGLGVTPSAWASGVRAFQNGAGALYTINTVQQRLSLNAYRDSAGTMRYINSSINANEFRMGEGDGSFQWFTAPSGTAGDAISFTQAATLTAAGDFLVGTTSTTNSARFACNNTAGTRKWGFGTLGSSTPFYVVDDTSGAGVQLTAGATSWSSFSDERNKTQIKPFENAVEKVCTLRAGTGRYLTDEESVSRSFLIAQDVQKVLPEAVDVSENEQGTLVLRYVDLIPLLIASIQELKREFDAYKAAHP